MKSLFKNILAVIAGIVIGGAVNMGLIMLGSSVIPPPEGVNPADMESLQEGIHLFEFRHFIFPFLAHTLGTLTGALVAGLLAASHNFKFAVAIGVFFLLGGITNVFLLPAPVWFIIIDLAGAYIPMGIIGGYLAKNIKIKRPKTETR